MTAPNLRLVDDDFDRWLHASFFLSELDPKAERFTFQTFDDVKLPDGKNRGSPKLISLFDGCINDNGDWERIKALNAQGAGIFVTANQTRLNGKRCNEEIIHRRAVWNDYDDADNPPPAFPLEPSLIVRTSPGKFQYWWLVDGLLAVDEFNSIMNVMVERYRSDPNAKGQARVLRLPGTFHCKREHQPFEVTWDWGARVECPPDADGKVRLYADGTPMREVRRYLPRELLDAFKPEAGADSNADAGQPGSENSGGEGEQMSPWLLCSTRCGTLMLSLARLGTMWGKR